MLTFLSCLARAVKYFIADQAFLTLRGWGRVSVNVAKVSTLKLDSYLLIQFSDSQTGMHTKALGILIQILTSMPGLGPGSDTS